MADSLIAKHCIPVALFGSLAFSVPSGAATNGPLLAAHDAVLYAFRGGSDGAQPAAGLVADKHGALYGTTAVGGVGGSFGNGTVFKLTPSGRGYTESVLYAFRGGNDGAEPFAGLIADKRGALYGTTAFTGVISGDGSVFKLTPSGNGYTESILYHFQGSPNDGAYPDASLIADENGALYGTTSAGGAAGIGTVFRLMR